MSNALAVEGRFTLINFLKSWVDSGLLTYKFSVHENALQPTRVRATFSKPTPESPATAAVAHLYFQLDNRLQNVLGFTVESETHFHSLQDLRFDETILDHVIRRKMVLKQQHLIRLSDEFSSTRVPALMKEKRNEKRDHDREGLEEYLLERFQRKDPYNDGRISFQECKDVLYSLEFPSIGRRDRDILFAFVELDRDDMVDYGALTSIGAEIIDTLLNVPEASLTQPSAKRTHDFEHVGELFIAAEKHQQSFTIHQLERILDDLRPPPPTPPEGTTKVDSSESKEPAQSNDGSSADEKQAGDTEVVDAKSESPVVPELYISRRQLRTSLESPQLLLSRQEINLMVALAVVAPSGQIPCSQLPELLQHVQTIVFRFQTRAFTDRIEHYVLQQFKNYESSKLQGTAEHIKKRLRLKEVKAVVKDMKKLMLSPLHTGRIVALCDETAGRGLPQVIQYEDYVDKISAYLAAHVDLDTLTDQLQARDDLDWSLSEELVRQHTNERFETLDTQRLGTVSADDFVSTVLDVTSELGLPLTAEEGAVIAAVADPTGQGRINYVFFQQILYPLLRQIVFSTAGTKSSTRSKADAKNQSDHDDNGKSYDEK